MDEPIEIVNELKVETKLFSFITLRILMSTTAGFFIGLGLANLVANQVKIVMIILCAFLGFFLCLPSNLNKGKRFYHSILFFLKRLTEQDTAYGMPDIENELEDQEPIMSSDDVYSNFDFARKEL